MAEDISKRKFRNWNLLLLLLFGCIYAFIDAHLIQSLIYFGLLTWVGIEFNDRQILGAADGKLLSLTPFFFDCSQADPTIRYLILLAGCILIFTLFCLYRENGRSKKQWHEHLHHEKLALFELLIQKRFQKQDRESSEEEEKKRTVPFTVPVGASIFLTFLISWGGLL